jgi:hypothetical protein
MGPVTRAAAWRGAWWASLAPGGVQRGDPGAGGGVEPPVTRLIRTTGVFFVNGFGFVKG